MSNYFFGQGKVLVAKRLPSGRPGAFKWLGDVSALSAALSVEKVEHNESYSGQLGLAKSFPRTKGCTVTMTPMELNEETLRIGLSATVSQTSVSTVTGEAFPADLVNGDIVALAHPKVADFVLKDSAAVTPATLVEGTHFTLDADFGSVVITDIATFTQPFVAAYDGTPVQNITMFSQQATNLWLRYEGINLAEEGRKCVVEFYNVSPDVLRQLDLINNQDLSSMEISAAVQIDSTKSITDEFGQFGRLQFL